MVDKRSRAAVGVGMSLVQSGANPGKPMPHTWSPAQLYVIRKEHPDLVEQEVPPLDWVVVKFLEEHDVQVKPVSMGDPRTGGERAADALVGGLAGPFAVAMQTGLRGQEKAVAAQEWTSWKQWALSHADFPAFKEKHIGAARKHNEVVEQRLSDHAFVEEWKTRFANQGIGEPALSRASAGLVGTWVAFFILGLTVVILISANQKQLKEWNERNQRSDSALVKSDRQV